MLVFAPSVRRFSNWRRTWKSLAYYNHLSRWLSIYHWLADLLGPYLSRPREFASMSRLKRYRTNGSSPSLRCFLLPRVAAQSSYREGDTGQVRKRRRATLSHERCTALSEESLPSCAGRLTKPPGPKQVAVNRSRPVRASRFTGGPDQRRHRHLRRARSTQDLQRCNVHLRRQRRAQNQDRWLRGHDLHLRRARQPHERRSRALAKDGMGQRDSAIADLDFAIGLQPTEPALFYFRGRFRIESSQYAAGVSDMDQTIITDLR
jgi:hypothetical protein